MRAVGGRWKPLQPEQVAERQVGKDRPLEETGKKGGRGEGLCSSPPQVAPSYASRGEAEGCVGFTPVAGLASGSREVPVTVLEPGWVDPAVRT